MPKPEGERCNREMPARNLHPAAAYLALQPNRYPEVVRGIDELDAMPMASLAAQRTSDHV